MSVKLLFVMALSFVADVEQPFFSLFCDEIFSAHVWNTPPARLFFQNETLIKKHSLDKIHVVSCKNLTGIQLKSQDKLFGTQSTFQTS